MNELVGDGPFDLSPGSSGLVLSGSSRDNFHEMSQNQIELTIDTDIPDSSSELKRKSNSSHYDDEFEFSHTLKFLKRNTEEYGEKVSPLSVTKSEIQMVQDISSQDGNYYISMIQRPTDSEILEGDFVSEDTLQNKQVFVTTEDKERALLLNKDDLTLCTVKGIEKDESEMKISVTFPMTISNDVSMPMRSGGITDSPVSGQETSDQDPLDHSYYRASQTMDTNYVDPVDPVRTMWVTTKADKNQLRQSGHTWKKGKWKKDEIDLLKNNIDKYCKDHGIKDAQQIIFHATKEERKNFYPTISVGLNRPLFAVYRRVKRMYDSQNYRGRYSEKEVEVLKDLRAKHGRDWSLIGQQMGRSSDSVKDRCRLFKDSNTQATGRWSSKEEVKLAKAVYETTGKTLGTSVTNNITWSTVASMVGSRTEKQCRAKWLNYLNWKLCNGDEWRKTDDQLLIQRIAALNVTSEDDIKWCKLTAGWSSVRSPQWLRGKWSNLKKLFYSEHPLMEHITLNELLKELNRIVAAQIANSWERYDCRKPYGSSADLPSSIIRNSSESDIAAARLQEEEEAESVYLDQIRPLHESSNSNTVFATVSNVALEQNLVIENAHPITGGSAPLLIKRRNGHIDNEEMRKMAEKFITAKQLKSSNQILEIPESSDQESVDETVQLDPTNTQGVFLLQNGDSDNQVVLLVADDVNFTITPEALSYLNRASKDETIVLDEGRRNDIIDGRHDNHEMSSSDDISNSRSDVITTSDVLVYQETTNDDDIKNQILGSAVHEVVAVANPEEGDDCFIETSSPLQGTLLEGTDLATSSIRIDTSC